MTSSTCIPPAGITSYLLMSVCLVVFAPLKATVNGLVAGADACVAVCFTLVIYPWFYGRLKQISSRICINILLISAHSLPWYITRWEERITSGDVLCLQSERFNSVERTITSFLVGLEVSWEGKLGRQQQEWLALKHTDWLLNCMHLSFTNVKQSKANFRI